MNCRVCHVEAGGTRSYYDKRLRPRDYEFRGFVCGGVKNGLKQCSNQAWSEGRCGNEVVAGSNLGRVVWRCSPFVQSGDYAQRSRLVKILISCNSQTVHQKNGLGADGGQLRGHFRNGVS